MYAHVWCVGALGDKFCGAPIQTRSAAFDIRLMDRSTLITPNEQVSNDHAIAKIARETHNPIPIVKRIYDEEFVRLRSSARIVEYVALFANRHTREILKGRRQRRPVTSSYAHA